VLARNHQVKLPAIEQPRDEFASIVDVFERALAQEQGVTHQIDALYELAFTERVFAAMAELQWFITEQVEEEKTVREIVAKFQMVKHDPASLLDLDRELGARQPDANAGEDDAA
jgi:ferritin